MAARSSLTVARSSLTAARSSPLRRLCFRMWRVTIFSPSTSRSTISTRVLICSKSSFATSLGFPNPRPPLSQPSTGCDRFQRVGADASWRSSQELDEELAHLLRLFLLRPMPGAIDKMGTAPLRTDGIGLHFLEDAGVLVGSPVALAGDEARRHVDGAARERALLGEGSGIGAAPHAVALQGASETSTGILGGIDADLGLGQPLAGRDLGDRKSTRL